MCSNKISDIKLINDLNEEKAIGIGLGISYFPIIKQTIDGGKIYDTIEGKITGAKWNYRDKEILLNSQNEISHVYPSVDMQYVIIVYSGKNNIIKEPKNAVVYSANGDVCRILAPPAFQSNLLLDQLRINGDENPPVNLDYPGALWFKQAYWRKNNKNEIVNVIQIGYDREWIEHRVFNPETGKFYECVHASRL